MRSTGIRPSLKLDRIVGARPDKKGLTIVPFKQEFVFPVPTKIYKKRPNVTKEGFKF